MSIQTRKQSIRQSIIAARSKIAGAERARLSKQIADRITGLDAYRTAATVLGYMNFGAEFAAETFVLQALRDGKQMLLPKVNRATKQLDIYRITDLAQDVAPGLWDIPEPLIERCTRIDDLSCVDFILLPGVAFGRNGERLGYGGGFYDKLLEKITHRPALVAAAFAMQVAEDIPQEPTDHKVEWLITEQETIRCAV
jgi:5-formyltetrahydrofolate cyclo-ligase